MPAKTERCGAGRPRTRTAARAGRRLALLAALALCGCKAPTVLTRATPEQEREVAALRSLSPEVDCLAVEYDHRAQEATRARDEAYDRVRFRYTLASEVSERLRGVAPTHVFLIAHGWMNGALGAQQFTSRWVNGLRERLPAGARPAYIGIHWDSERLVFHESALVAQLLGRKQVAPLLVALRRSLPAARIALVGHSLGGRMMLSTLNAAPSRSADLALLLEAAADLDWLHASSGVPRAGDGAHLIVNVHSLRDQVLDLAYRNAMRSPALGRMGAERAPGARFATIPLRDSPAAEAFAAALAQPGVRFASGGGRVLNVDATSLISGHTEIFHAPVFDLGWLAMAQARSN